MSRDDLHCLGCCADCNEAGIAEGRREALWAVYAACMYARGHGDDFFRPLACMDSSEIDQRGFRGLFIGHDVACGGMAESALQALADLGDERARSMVET